MDALHRADALTVSLPQPWPINPWPTRFRTVRASPDGALDPGLRMVTVQSPALGGRADVAIHHTQAAPLPADVAVVVMLHGVYGSFWNWMLTGSAHRSLDRLVAAGEIEPMVLIATGDGLRGEGTAYLSHSQFDVERWVIDETVAIAAEMTAEVTEDSPIFLVGNSMGAFGAARLGLEFADLVAGIALHSAITHLDQLREFTVGGIGDEDELDPARRSLPDLFANHPAPPPTYLDCGTDDPLIDANRDLHDRLVMCSVEHEYHEFDGGHNWDAWSIRINDSLRFFDLLVKGTR